MTTIQVSESLRDRLRDLGRKGQTYEEIIEQLLENVGKSIQNPKANAR